jgi:hypothetical protein
LIEPVQPTRSGGSTAVGATPSTASAGTPDVATPTTGTDEAPSAPTPTDAGPEDPTVPDTAVEATLATEPTGSRPAAQPAPTYQQTPDSSQPGAPAREVVYLAAPVRPKKKGNRAIGALMALLSAVVFLILYALFAVLIRSVTLGDSSIGFLNDISFYVPVLLFVIGFIILALILNRAGWWSFVFGSLFVGVFVYLGTIALLLLMRAGQLTPADAILQFRQFLTNPLVIAAGLVAREVALWVGAAISARGRRVTARNAEARDNFDREQAERRAEFERNGAAVTPA